MKPSDRRLRNKSVTFVLFAVLVSVGIAAQADSELRDTYSKAEYMIPMRDGTKLYTAVYSPKGKDGAHPILLRRTPYGAGPYGPEAYRHGLDGSPRFMEAGYIFAYQDVRGRGQSEGRFFNVRPEITIPLKPNDIDESTDTWDTIDYLVKRVPANNGRVGLWGISYPGFYAGIGAVNSHPALKVASPQAPVSDWFLGDDFHHNGALFLMDAIGFARFGESAEASASWAGPKLDTKGDPVSFYMRYGTLASLTDTFFVKTDGMWRFLMEHGTYDEYWQSCSLPFHLRGVRCPLLVVGGWFDAEDFWGALHTARAARKYNPRIHTTLVIGPWWHGGWAGADGDHIGEMEFGQKTSEFYREQIEFPYLDACLRGNGRPDAPAAEVFETGANRWRTFAQWPPRSVRERSLYLEPGKRLDIGTTGDPGGSEFDEYVSDPENPVPYEGGAIHGRTREYMVDDQRFAAARPDVLAYESAPLTRAMTIAGPITADLFVETTGTDADFIVKLIDVIPDAEGGTTPGYQNLLRAEVMRAKFRDSYQNPSPLTPGQVTRVSFTLPDLLHTFKAGHRVMVQVQSSWFPLVDRNPQRFVDIYHARPQDFQKATIRVYHGEGRRSRLIVGVLQEATR